MTWDVYQYNESVDIDIHVENARLISLTIDISHVEDVELRIMFEKIQHCGYNVSPKYVWQLPYHDCDFFRLAPTIVYTRFLTQPSQILNIGMDPTCPIIHCIDMTVTVVDTSSAVVQNSYEWRNTTLEYVPIIVEVPGYVTISWTDLDKCQANHTMKTLCDVLVNVTGAFMMNFNKLGSLHKEDNYIRSVVSPHIHLLHFCKV